VVSVDDPARLREAQRLAKAVTGTDESAALYAAGQGIRVVAPEGPQTSAVIAYAHDRTLTAPSLADPGLRAFLDYWLGRAG
jgi:hypothetical protein